MGQNQSVSQTMATSIMNSITQRAERSNRADVVASVTNYIDARNMNATFLVINQKARVSVNLESFAQFASDMTVDQNVMAELLNEASAAVQQIMVGVSDQEVDMEMNAEFQNTAIVENALMNSCSTSARINNTLDIPDSKVGVGWITQEGFAEVAAKCLLQDDAFMKAAQGVEARLRQSGKTDSKSLLEALAALGIPGLLFLGVVVVASGYFGTKNAQIVTKSPYFPLMLFGPPLILISLLFTLDCGGALPLFNLWLPLLGTVPVPYKGACKHWGGVVGYIVTFMVVGFLGQKGMQIAERQISANAPPAAALPVSST
jgi:hypothetical protein